VITGSEGGGRNVRGSEKLEWVFLMSTVGTEWTMLVKIIYLGKNLLHPY
jgi:hypothetical protein